MGTHQIKSKGTSPGQDLCLGNLLDSIPGNVVVIKSNGKIVEVTPGWRDFAVNSGLNPAIEWIGQDYTEACEKVVRLLMEEMEKAIQGVKAILSGKRKTFELEYLSHVTGEERWFKMQATGFVQKDEIWATIIHSEITVSKLQEFALKSSEEEFRNLMEQAPFFDSNHDPRRKNCKGKSGI